MFIGWSYTRFLFLVLIGNPTWLPGPIMCFDWSKFKKSSWTNQNTLWALVAMLDFRSAPKTKILYMTIQWTFLPSMVQICFVVSEKKLARNVHLMVLYQICVFGADLKSNMAARAHNVF
jgi:hypothetical protein